MLRSLTNVWSRTSKYSLAGAVLVVVCAAAALASHSLNVSYGDDYALYVRQARGLLDGDVARVIDDNAYLVSAKGADTPDFTPGVYPWVTSLLAVPFVRLFGHTSFEDLRLAMVVALCAWVVAFLYLLRDRVRRPAAIAITAIVALNTQYLTHTDTVMSEIPYLLVVTLLLLVFDRVQSRHDPLRLPWPAAWQLGAVGCLAFNTRREGLAVVPALVAWQLLSWWRAGRHRASWRDVGWHAIGRPYAALVVSCIVFQLVLPSTLFPSYEGSGLSKSFRHLAGPYRRVVGEALGLGDVAILMFIVVALAVIGAVDRLRNGHDAALVTFVVCSSVLSASHRIVVDRYMLMTAPFVLYLAYQGWAYLLFRARRHLVALLVPLAVLLAATVWQTAGTIDDVRAARAAHEYRLGPGSPAEDEGFDAVLRYTSLDDTVAFFKGRLMTLITDRRSLQTLQPDVILLEADYYLQRYDRFEPPDGGFSPFLGVPQFTDEQAAEAGLTEVWRNDRWVLWRIP